MGGQLGEEHDCSIVCGKKKKKKKELTEKGVGAQLSHNEYSI